MLILLLLQSSLHLCLRSIYKYGATQEATNCYLLRGYKLLLLLRGNKVFPRRDIYILHHEVTKCYLVRKVSLPNSGRDKLIIYIYN